MSACTLGSNSLTGPLPTELGQMTKLKSFFDVWGNSLTGTLPTQLGTMTKITDEFKFFSNRWVRLGERGGGAWWQGGERTRQQHRRASMRQH